MTLRDLVLVSLLAFFGAVAFGVRYSAVDAIPPLPPAPAEGRSIDTDTRNLLTLPEGDGNE